MFACIFARSVGVSVDVDSWRAKQLMLALGPSDHSNVYREPTDLQKGFDSLCGLVRTGIERDPLGGNGYVFINRRRRHIKL